MAAQQSPKLFVGVRVPPGKPVIVRWPSGPRQLPAKQPNRGFESHPHFHHGVVAQLGERLLCKQNVAGSIPVNSTMHISDWDNR